MNKLIMKSWLSLAVGVLLIGSTFLAVDARFNDNGMMNQAVYQVEELSATELKNLEKMLTVLINDEYQARAEYEAIIDEFGAQAPFTNLVKAETMHINALTRLFNAYELDVPSDNSKNTVVPDSVEKAYAAGIVTEKESIVLYEKYLDQDLPVSVERVFTNLQNASKNHLATFEAYEDGKTFVGCDQLHNSRDNQNQSNQNRRMGRNW